MKDNCDSLKTPSTTLPIEMSASSSKNSSDASNPSRMFLQEGLLVAWVPVAFYFLTYCYERSYVGALGIPSSFVQVGPQEMIDFVFSLTVCWWMLIAIVGFLIESRGIPHKISAAKWSYFFAISFALLLVLINGSFFSVRTLGYFGFIAGLAMFDYVLSRLSKDKKMKGFFALIFDESLRTNPSDRPIEYFLYKLVFVTSLGFIIATSAGQHSARDQTVFTISAEDNTLILVYYDENKAVCATYDPSTHRVSGEVVILPVAEKGRSKFINASLGYLNFKTTLGS